MSTHDMQFHFKKKKSLNVCFLEISKNFVGTQKRVRISHGIRAIGVRAIEVRLHIGRYSRLLLYRLRLSRITAYLEVKIRSLFSMEL